MMPVQSRRQILIHNAVTRGLNPDVPMKDSGVEWIGEIPVHWEVKKLKYLLTERGDILLARVGRGCIGKVCMIGRGRVPVSDCVYRIRVAKKHRTKIWDAFVSEAGQKWLKANAHGVCAKVISKKDLYKFPIV